MDVFFGGGSKGVAGDSAGVDLWDQDRDIAEVPEGAAGQRLCMALLLLAMRCAAPPQFQTQP